MKLITKIRLLILFFMFALIISGATAMPAETGLRWLMQYKDMMPQKLGDWLQTCYLALVDTNDKYPFLAYGYDWLAFAHFVLAILFIGPLKDPVRNKWVIEFGMIACLLIIPFAFIAGHFRGIPVGWRLIDCAFGVVGLIPLSICLSKITVVERKMAQSLNQNIFLTA